MKTTYLSIICVLVSSISSVKPCHADLPRESMFYNADLDNVAISAGYDDLARKVRSKNNYNDKDLLEADQGYMLLTYDLCPWLDVNGGIGQAKAKPASAISAAKVSENKLLWTIGMHANIWQGDIFEPEYFMSRCKLQSSLSFWSSDSSAYGYNLKWNETRADITFSVEIFSTGLGENTTESPYSLELFAGALYSVLYVDGSPTLADNYASVSPEMEEIEPTGLRTGVNLKVYHNLTVGWEARIFDEMTQTATISYHF